MITGNPNSDEIKISSTETRTLLCTVNCHELEIIWLQLPLVIAALFVLQENVWKKWRLKDFYHIIIVTMHSMRLNVYSSVVKQNNILTTFKRGLANFMFNYDLSGKGIFIKCIFSCTVFDH